jgi:hypothetical protein
MKREEMVELRTRLIRGDPPYDEIDLMGKPKRGKGGVPGLDERKALGDYDPGAGGLRLSFEALVKLIDHFLERMK